MRGKSRYFTVVAIALIGGGISCGVPPVRAQEVVGGQGGGVPGWQVERRGSEPPQLVDVVLIRPDKKRMGVLPDSPYSRRQQTVRSERLKSVGQLPPKRYSERRRVPTPQYYHVYDVPQEAAVVAQSAGEDAEALGQLQPAAGAVMPASDMLSGILDVFGMGEDAAARKPSLRMRVKDLPPQFIQPPGSDSAVGILPVPGAIGKKKMAANPPPADAPPADPIPIMQLPVAEAAAPSAPASSPPAVAEEGELLALPGFEAAPPESQEGGQGEIAAEIMVAPGDVQAVVAGIEDTEQSVTAATGEAVLELALPGSPAQSTDLAVPPFVDATAAEGMSAKDAEPIAAENTPANEIAEVLPQPAATTMNGDGLLSLLRPPYALQQVTSEEIVQEVQEAAETAAKTMETAPTEAALHVAGGEVAPVAPSDSAAGAVPENAAVPQAELGQLAESLKVQAQQEKQAKEEQQAREKETRQSVPVAAVSIPSTDKEILKAIENNIAPQDHGEQVATAPIDIRHNRAVDPALSGEGMAEVKTHEAMGIQIAIKAPPPNVNYQLEMAYEALMAARPEVAVEYYGDALQMDPKNPIALFGLATTYHRIGDFDSARELYGKLIALEPRHTEAITNYLGLLAEEQPDKALTELKILQQANPDFSPVAAQLAMIYERMGDFSQAVDEIMRAVKLSPENLSYRYNYAILLDKSGRWEEAVRAYRQLIAASERGQPIPGNVNEIQERLTFIMSNNNQ